MLYKNILDKMDNFETEIENEGTINIPKISSKPKIFLSDNKRDKPLLRMNSFLIDNKNESHKLCMNYEPGDQFNYTTINNKNKFNLKNEDLISETTKASRTSLNYKIKRVTFSTVEIIRVEKYKKYNKLNTIKKTEKIKRDSDYCIIY